MPASSDRHIPGRPEHGDHYGATALLERPARARALQPRQVIGGEDGHGLVGDVWRPQPGHRVRLRDYTTLNSSPLTEYLALAALRNVPPCCGHGWNRPRSTASCSRSGLRLSPAWSAVLARPAA